MPELVATDFYLAVAFTLGFFACCIKQAFPDAFASVIFSDC